MAILNLAIPRQTRNTSTTSKWDLIFGELGVSTEDMNGNVVGPVHVEVDFVNTDKAKNKINGAIDAYRRRTGDKSAFTVRVLTAQDSPEVAALLAEAGGVEALGVWKLNKQFTPRQAKAKPPVAQ